ncbi:MAG: hypothetical protein PUK59_02365 [Actinomycetaceae bacterium]|nr:hypothetical protein [Actinomycetaceae bacterium]
MGEISTTMQMWLTGYGELEWAQVCELLASFSCAYADYEGFHVNVDCPEEAPDYTHLWAWKDGEVGGLMLARVRINAGKGIVGVLTQDRADILPAPSIDANEKGQGVPNFSEATSVARPVAVTKEVAVNVTAGIQWGVEEKRIGRQYGASVTDVEFAVISPELRLSSTFVCPKNFLPTDKQSDLWEKSVATGKGECRGGNR